MFINRRSRHARRKSLGFTLIELAVVLGVLGIVTAGLWRLMSTSTQQTKDQATAQQQLALINAVKGYLADSTPGTGGQSLMTAPGTKIKITLPVTNASLTTCRASLATATPPDTGLCSYLPPGFTAGTVNPYGQAYNIQLLTGANTATQGYSFMIMTSGGSTIPDANGARISSLIGGDGGFLYSSTNVCGGTVGKTACGAMGAWSTDVTNYGFGAAGSGGWIASQSFVATAGTLDYDWLARQVMPGDSGVYTYNTMTTDLFMGAYNSATDAYSGSTAPAIHLHAGILDMDGGVIDLGYKKAALPLPAPQPPSPVFATGAIIGQASSIGTPQISFNVDTGNGSNYITNGVSFIQLTAGCSGMDASGGVTYDVTTTCPPVISVPHGDIAVANGAVLGENILHLSDARFKADIHTIKNALGNIMKIKPVSFVYKNNNRPGMGVTAQDLEKTYPQLVVDYNGTKYVEYDGLIGPLIGSVQELKRENDELRQKLREQSDRIDRLEGGVSVH